jgi:hypothetical protein
MPTSLAELIGKTNPGEDTRLRQAIVTSAPSGGTCTIRFGDLASTTTADDIAGVSYLSGVGLFNGDTVWVLQTGGALLIIGRVAGAADAWMPYVPTNIGITVGNGVLTARYQRIGRTVAFSWDLVWGSTTAFTTTIEIGLPFAAQAPVGVAQVAAAVLVDISAGFYAGGAMIAFTDVQKARVIHAVPASNTGNVNGTSPFTWSSGDRLTVQGTYEAAS